MAAPRFNWQAFTRYREQIDQLTSELDTRDISTLDYYVTQLASFYRNQGIDPYDEQTASIILLTIQLFLFEQTEFIASIPTYQIPEVHRFVVLTSRMFGLFLRDVLEHTPGVPEVKRDAK